MFVKIREKKSVTGLTVGTGGQSCSRVDITKIPQIPDDALTELWHVYPADRGSGEYPNGKN